MKTTRHIGLILLLVGLGLFINGYKGSGGDIGAINGRLGTFEISTGTGAGLEDRRADFDPEGIRRIDLREANAQIKLTVSPDDQIHVLWQEQEDDRLSVKTNGETLTLKRNGDHFGIYLGLSDTTPVTQLQLPSGLKASVEIRSGNGSVTAERIELAGDIGIDSDNGTVTLNGVSLDTLTVKNDNGKIQLSGACGAVTLEGNNGAILVTDLTCGLLDIDADNGGVSLTDITAEKTVSADLDNGSIELKNVAAGQGLSFQSDLGSIRGTLAGSIDDYRIEAKTDLGKCNLPSGWTRGSIPLTVSTDLGSIDISFLED